MLGQGTDLDEELRLGVVGVGTIASALIRAVVTSAGGDRLSVVLSPRSASRSAALAAEFSSVRVLADNQAVIDSSEMVILSVLPGELRETCAGLRFRSDQIIIGVAAGWPPSALRGLVAPATRICQLIPLPMVALHQGPVVAFPCPNEVRELLIGCGSLIEVEREEDLIAFSCASALMSTFFQLQEEAAAWLHEVGVGAPASREYMTSLFAGLALEASIANDDEAPRLVGDHETPGGMNEQVRSALSANGAFEELRRVLSRMHRERLQPR